MLMYENDNGDDYCVPCDPIFCPLSPANLAIFEARVKPLSLDTPPKDLENWFHTTIEYILEIKEIQLAKQFKTFFSKLK